MRQITATNGVEAVVQALAALRSGEPVAVAGAPLAEADVIMLTSGSTARAKAVRHTRSGVDWAARAGIDVLGAAEWQWVVTLNPNSAGGLAMLNRSVITGREPLVWPGLGTRFEAGAVARWFGDRPGAYAISLVSTQVARLLGTADGSRMLAAMRAVLVGGGPFPESLSRRCQEAGVNAIATYGATETAGGCVYDGIPWPGVEVSEIHGELLIDGPMLAQGYVGQPDFERPWRTGDLGEVTDRVHVFGHAGDRVPVRGTNVFLADYEAEAMSRPDVVDAVAVAVPHPVDGYRVVTFVADAEHDLPRLPNGKADRAELRRRALGDSGAVD